MVFPIFLLDFHFAEDYLNDSFDSAFSDKEGCMSFFLVVFSMLEFKTSRSRSLKKVEA